MVFQTAENNEYSLTHYFLIEYLELIHDLLILYYFLFEKNQMRPRLSTC